MPETTETESRGERHPSSYLAFRGKARAIAGGQQPWHPTAYHCLDVAACMDGLLTARPQTLAHASGLLGMSGEETVRFLRSLAVLHDIGKFSESFFGQVEDLWPDVLGTYSAEYPKKPHTAAGYALWRDRLRAEYSQRIVTGDPFDAEPLFLAAFGHHGRPLIKGQTARSNEYFASDSGRDAAVAFANDAIALVCAKPVNAPSNWERRASRASWLVAGMVSIADWLGSNQRWFPYHPPTLELATYWEHATKRAHLAVREAGLLPATSAPLTTFARLTGLDREPSPVQRWAADVTLPETAALYIIEDVTGAGKTEAAQVIVHRLMATGRASGAYWAMPTQATANAMYERQRETIAALFADDGVVRPSLVLTHGQARLHERFRSTVLEFCTSLTDAALDSEAEEGSDSAIACASFIADDRRASLLADVGAGTIDQVLLGILPSKFNTIRLFGLAEKVLVLDEVHAYDAYMREELIALLRFHAALGGSAIILSATLPAALRKSLVDAWQQVIGARKVALAIDAQSGGEEGSIAAYPLVTIVPSDAPATEWPLEAAAASRRQVPVKFVHETSDVLELICDANASGMAVAWIRNTVDSCLTAAELLRARGLDPLVFHARFAQCDRQAREREVMNVFGRDSRGAERSRVLVATQVVEQSLDLDFDMLITDLAPIDLVVQRAGRLWRHPDRVRPPESKRVLHVLTPPFTKEPDVNWLDALLPKTKNVYGDAGILWRSLRTLYDCPSINTPDGIRAMIESVYASEEVPANLERAAGAAEGKSRAQGSTARNFSLRLEDGYCGDFYAGWYSDLRVPTRLIDEQTVVRLATIDERGEVTPWTGGSREDWRAWALSEVRLSRWKLPKGTSIAPGQQASVEAIRVTWPKYERDVLVVPLHQYDRVWLADLTRPDGSMARLEYTATAGVTWRQQGDSP